MRTVAEAFSGENNILPLDSRGLAKHHQPGNSAQCCHCYQLTPPTHTPRVMQKMVGSVLPEEQETHHYSFRDLKSPAAKCLSDSELQCLSFAAERQEKKRWGQGAHCS